QHSFDRQIGISHRHSFCVCGGTAGHLFGTILERAGVRTGYLSTGRIRRFPRWQSAIREVAAVFGETQR
ncbi:MAG TPA: hypothetical protein VN839_02935, partial [Patescibacteria group bacterium]|nr:hypothetical protein [Patescibacteria group bacterium]